MVMLDDLLCVGWRLKNASIPPRAEHPLILRKCHPVVDMIVRYEHENNAHVGREHVLSLAKAEILDNTKKSCSSKNIAQLHSL